MVPNIDDIRTASQRIKPYANKTPVLTSSMLNELTGARLYFKCENFQKVGAFKFRGACNAVFSLSEKEAQKGVVTHSSGNHAQALALAAKIRGIPSYIVMPNNSPEVKKKAVAGYGAHITYCEPDLKARETTTEAVIKKTGAIFIHPYDDPRIIAGQGTAAMELIENQPNLDFIISPVGGGGLLSGTALSTTSLSPDTKVIAAEPEMANDAYLSFKEKKFILSDNPQTICDGLLTSLSDLTFKIMLQNVSDVMLASETNILLATQYIWERMKIIVEPSAAVSLAIILQHPDAFKNKTIGLILSGGNVDVKELVKHFS